MRGTVQYKFNAFNCTAKQSMKCLLFLDYLTLITKALQLLGTSVNTHKSRWTSIPAYKTFQQSDLETSDIMT